MRTLRRRFLVSLSLLVVCLVWVGSVNAGFFDGKKKFYTIKTEHFYIHYPEGIGPIADDMRTIVEEQFQNITSRLEWKPKGRTHVVLSDKTDQANGLATVLPQNHILLYVTKPGVDSSLDVYKDYLRMLFAHELQHIVHIDMHYRWATLPRALFGKIIAPNGATPGWMREGMAVYEESKLAEGFGRINAPYSEMVLRTAHYDNQFPNLGQISGGQRHFPGGLGPYLFGGKFFEWLGNKYGEDRMYKYQKLYASGLWFFSLNNKSRRVYDKSFYKLWKEFRADMAQKYDGMKTQLASQGLTTFEDVVNTKDRQRYYTPRPGGGFAYFNGNMDEPSQIVIQSPDGKPVNLKRKIFGQMAYSKNGRYLAFGALAAVERKTARSEIYYYDTKKKSLYRVYDKENPKSSMRVSDPDFSPLDGGQRWLVMVRKFLDTDQLYIYDLYEKRGYTITNEPKNTSLANPRFSPDGQKIVVSRKDPVTGYRDIVVYKRTGEFAYQITQDITRDNHPVFSNDGRYIYFDSYRTGISNIYRFDTANRELQQITNVVDGVFQPVPDASGNGVVVQRYSSDKTYLQRFQPSTVYSTIRLGGDPKKKSKKSKHADLFLEMEEEDDVLMSSRRYSVVPVDQGSEYQLIDKGAKQVALTEDTGVQEVENSIENFFGENHADHGDSSQSFHSNYMGGVAQFSQNPEDISPLPDTMFDGLAVPKRSGDTTKKTPVKKVKTKKVKSAKSDESVQQPKIYPSEYKNLLGAHPDKPLFDVSNPSGSKKYSPLPQLLVPKYVMPNFLFFENAALLGVTVGKSDPLYRHAWTAFANYRTDAKFVGGGGTYIYSRWDPLFYIGGLRYAVDWGELSVSNPGGTTTTVRFFEERQQMYAGTSFNIKRHQFNFSYFYEHRSAFTDLSSLGITLNLVNMKPYAGFRFQYTLSNFKKYPDSISQESGYQLKIAGTWTDKRLGAENVNEEQLIQADFRYYLEMPWSDHHVLAFRVAGATVWGDVQQFGVYRMGGPFGEGIGANYSARAFPLRGLAGITYGGDRVFMFSTEYRFPIVDKVHKGAGTMPIYLDRLHGSFFVDGGDIKYRTEVPDLFTRMMVSVGAELKGDFVIGYGLPVTFRGGYAIILTNRDRLANLIDSTTRQSLRYGSVYLQLGTMF